MKNWIDKFLKALMTRVMLVCPRRRQPLPQSRLRYYQHLRIPGA